MYVYIYSVLTATLVGEDSNDPVSTTWRPVQS